MKKTAKCIECDRKLMKDEVALSKKLLEDTNDYYCLECFSRYLGCSEQDLIDKIQEFKEQGCTLFL